MKGIMELCLVVVTGCVAAGDTRGQTVEIRQSQTEASLHGWEFDSLVDDERGIANEVIFIGDAPSLVVNYYGFIEVVNLQTGDAETVHPRRLRNFMSICGFGDDSFLVADSSGEVARVGVNDGVREEVADLQLKLPHRICAHVETRRVATAHQGDAVLLWDWRDPAQAVSVDIHRLGALDIAISPNGTQCAATTYDSSVRLLDWERGVISTVVAPPNSDVTEDDQQSFSAVAWHHQGRHLAALRGDTVYIWDGPDWTGSRAVTLREIRGVDITFSPKGESVVVAGTASGRKALALVDTQSGDVSRVAIGGAGQCTSVVFSIDGEWMAVCNLLHGVSLWREEVIIQSN